jgi:hypothetical protein
LFLRGHLVQGQFRKPQSLIHNHLGAVEGLPLILSRAFSRVDPPVRKQSRSQGNGLHFATKAFPDTEVSYLGRGYVNIWNFMEFP